MFPLLTTTDADFPMQFQHLRRHSAEAESAVESRVRAILTRVRRDGDRAVLDLTAHYDGLALTPETIGVSTSEIATAYEQCSPGTLAALRSAAENIRRF